MSPTPQDKHVTFGEAPPVPSLGQGSWNLGQDRHPRDGEREALALGLELGLHVIDTAEMYGDGASERLIGEVLRARRESCFLVSKVYPHHAEPAAMRRACEASLERLGTDSLDLYLLHWRGGADLADAVAGFEALREAGKIKAWGVSNFDVDDMEALLRIPGGQRCVTNQVLYNVEARGIEFDLLPWCQARGMPIMAYSPLGSRSGLLDHPVLKQIAVKHGACTASVALSWVMRLPGVLAIPESGDAAHVRANAAALSLRLDRDDCAQIDRAFPPPQRKAPLAML